MVPKARTTERLLLRRWRPADRAPFAAMNADAEVMRYFPASLDRAASDAMVDRIEAGFEADGVGLWALERLSDGQFLGYTGLMWQRFDAHFTPALEVGWRLARPAWGNGYATEAARAALVDGFARTGVGEIVSMTAASNERSQAVMRRLGMRRDPGDDFAHPGVASDHRLSPHRLFRLSRAECSAAPAVASTPRLAT